MRRSHTSGCQKQLMLTEKICHDTCAVGCSQTWYENEGTVDIQSMSTTPKSHDATQCRMLLISACSLSYPASNSPEECPCVPQSPLSSASSHACLSASESSPLLLFSRHHFSCSQSMQRMSASCLTAA